MEQTLSYAQQKALSLGIQNPNSCGQGKHPSADFVPYGWRVVRAGWIYSHTTAVVHPVGRNVLHHTFRRGDHAVTFYRDENGRYGRWAGSWGGSGMETVFLVDSSFGPEPLVRYLSRVARYGRERRREGF